MDIERASGVLLHISSLPSAGPIGDLGPASYEFIEWLATAGQSYWQVLPLNPVGMGNSPYSATSAFAGNTSFISLEKLADDGWLEKNEIQYSADNTGHADFTAVRAWKVPLLRKAAANFLSHGMEDDQDDRFRQFCRAQRNWLEDFVLFQSLRGHMQDKGWHDWPRELAKREPHAIQQARAELAEEMEIERVLQFAFFTQWESLRSHARSKGVKMFGDIAIFVNDDSTDVWANPWLFKLDEELRPTVVAGVPPDDFSKTGQRWGNPIYRWDVLRDRGYDWWIERVRWNFALFDLLRLDHFRGFDQFWEIPASEPTAVNGRWVDGPRDDLFHALDSAMGKLELVAEDLGTITPSVRALLDRMKMPGMKVLQFAFGGDGGDNPYLPHNHTPNSVVYTGTHDNDTTAGWWNSLDIKTRKRVNSYLGATKASNIPEALIRTAMTSVASLALVPMQDVLGLDGEARMNTPSRTDGNWGWRMRPGELDEANANDLYETCKISGRCHK